MAITQNTTTYPLPQRHVIGDLVTRFYNLTGTGSGDTFTVPFANGDLLSVDVQPTTNVSVGSTTAASSSNAAQSVITFTASGAWTAVVQVIARAG